jgi:Flp pilus assembly protein TadD
MSKEKIAEEYFEQGIANAKKGEYDRAIENYNKAIELKPDDAEAYYNRGIAYKNKGEYDRTIENYIK